MQRTYSTESERQAALAEAREEYARTGVLHTPMPAELARHEATRYRRLNVEPVPGLRGATAAQLAEARADGRALVAETAPADVAQIVQEAADSRVGLWEAVSDVARRLREAGATEGQVTEAMRRVQDAREHDARAFEAGDQRAAAALHRLRSPFQSPRSPLVW
jgi:hypothetical protein